jgi:hypothetical protein
MAKRSEVTFVELVHQLELQIVFPSDPYARSSQMDETESH